MGVSVTRTDEGNSKSPDEEVKNRFIVKTANKTTELLIDTVTGVEYLKLYPTQFRNSNETITCIPLLDESGFPSINKEWKESHTLDTES